MEFVELCSNFSQAIVLLPDDVLSEMHDNLRYEIKERRRVKHNHKSKKEYDVFTVSILGQRNVYPIKEIREPMTARVKHLRSLIDQDWKYLFEDMSLDPSENYYVYAHIRPKSCDHSASRQLKSILGTSGIPFYIGKGTGNRAWDLNRNQGHGIQLKNLLSSGASKESIVFIIKDNLSELEAFELESKLIYFFGTIYERKAHGVPTGSLYNLDIGKRPIFSRDGKAFTIYKRRGKRKPKLTKDECRLANISWHGTSASLVGDELYKFEFGGI